MNIQGSINQLLVLSAAAAKTSPALQQKTKLKSLDESAEKLNTIIEEEKGKEGDIDTLYKMKEEAFYMDPSEERNKELEKLYPKTTKGIKEKQLSDQATKEKEAKHEEFAQKFSEGVGFNPVQKAEPSWRQAGLEAQRQLNNKQEEKRQSRLNSKIGGGL